MEVLRESPLSFFDGLGPVLGGDLGKVWELSGGREVVGEDGEQRLGDGHVG